MNGERPETEYGPYQRGNVGQVGRLVTAYTPSILFPGEWMPLVTWEPHPDEATPDREERKL